MERDTTGALFEPDILISQKYLKIYQQTKRAEPEKKLMLAVFVDALQTYQKFAFSRSARGKALFREAESWFWREKPDCVFSFSSICEVFGLNPPFLRRGLLQWVEDHKRRGASRKRFQLRTGAGRTRKPTLAPERRAS
jgi:hypothetical protein